MEFRPKLRTAVVQFAPILGNVQANLEKAKNLCSQIQPYSVDLVCLPEMIMTGYVFPNAKAIEPFLEVPKIGPTSKFCEDLARQLHCYVIAGYPEVLKPKERDMREDGSEMVGANSAIIYDPDGNYVGGYRKINMFETDKTWARPGDRFKSFTLPSLPSGLQTLSVGICMDLNPHPPNYWASREGPFELAEYCRNKNEKPRTNILVLLNAWLDSKADMHNQDVDMQTVAYWTARLRPLWDNDHNATENDVTSTDRKDVDSHAETIVIICNRSGEENGTLFAGSSAVLRLREGSSKPEIVNLMGRREEGVRILSI